MAATVHTNQNGTTGLCEKTTKKCRNATTGAAEALSATKGRKSATDSECLAMLAKASCWDGSSVDKQHVVANGTN